jgi:succinate-semialdehyde dehydrogenase/glutarate-semialdehyde dehydrogenase
MWRGNSRKFRGGYWCRPTVLTQVNHAMKVMTAETFGPIMPVMAVSSPAEAVQLANDTEYGLSAAVFTGSEAEAIAIAHQTHIPQVRSQNAVFLKHEYFSITNQSTRSRSLRHSGRNC